MQNKGVVVFLTVNCYQCFACTICHSHWYQTAFRKKLQPMLLTLTGNIDFAKNKAF